MLNHQIIEQSLELQKKSYELTEGVRRVFNDASRKLSEINYQAGRYLSSMMQEYFDKFGMVHNPATLPQFLGVSEMHEIYKYLEGYQSSVNIILQEGNNKILVAFEELSSHARSDCENIVHGLTTNGVMGTEPYMQIYRLYFDAYINGCDQMAATTRNALICWGQTQVKN